MSGKREIVPGDLCVIVGCASKNNGIFLRVTERDFSQGNQERWFFKDASRGVLFGFKASSFCLSRSDELRRYGPASIPSRFLIPIRDAEGEDEMLRIAGKPRVVEGAPA